MEAEAEQEALEHIQRRPREQSEAAASEAAAIVEQSYAQHPRLNYIYKNLPEIKPEEWEWRL